MSKKNEKNLAGDRAVDIRRQFELWALELVSDQIRNDGMPDDCDTLEHLRGFAGGMIWMRDNADATALQEFIDGEFVLDGYEPVEL